MTWLQTLTVRSGRPSELAHPIGTEIQPVGNVEPMALLKRGNGQWPVMGTVISLLKDLSRNFYGLLRMTVRACTSHSNLNSITLKCEALGSSQAGKR
ncbi:hypothetical protein [Absidia glauca]|uniref:Uncharacterized protein n=1 Tax=Absidia glauca TaxID=4829 RepID=A0A163JTW6_ABSGL|nr:hypothetical protein [Absidia glauca]